MTDWTNSTYLDYAGYGLTLVKPLAGSAQSDVEAAFGITDGKAVADTTTTTTITVALTLDRANDASTLLSSNWATRQAMLAAANTKGGVGQVYGASQGDYNALVNELGAQSIPIISGTNLSSAESRTVWVTLDATQFQTLFGTTLMEGKPSIATKNFGSAPGSYTPQEGGRILYWNGSLDPSVSVPLDGMWIEHNTDIENGLKEYGKTPTPVVTNATALSLPDGSLGIGNSAPSVDKLFPNAVAQIYGFPLIGSSVATPTVGLVANGIGDHTPFHSKTIGDFVPQFLKEAGVSGSVTVGKGTIEAVTSPPSDNVRERSLDVSVVAAVSPNSNQVLYAGDGAGSFSSMQEAIWDSNNTLGALSSSFSESQRSAPGSPFYAAYQGLMEDAALRNISVFMSAGDGGSSEKIGEGIPMTDISHDSPYTVVVGGTSISSQSQAEVDPTLITIISKALAGDRATLLDLVAGGLRTMPTAATDISLFIETVWNQYVNRDGMTNGLTGNKTAAGGVDPAFAEPGYQTAYGINITKLSYNGQQAGRGIPDVAALSDGNTKFLIMSANGDQTTTDGGTSASAPLWAALTAQIQAIFADQGLPTTGYFNDLLYTAAAVTPASFNDVTVGSNTSSFVYGGTTTDTTSDRSYNITPTGIGYSAGPGYDLTTGLGTPNGTVLARALTQIAHAQMYSATPTLTDSTGAVASVGGVLLVQSRLAAAGTVSVGGQLLVSGAFNPFSWTSQFAQQSLQASFDPALVTLFDHDAQGATTQVAVSSSQALNVSIDGMPAISTQTTLTAPFGFVTYGDGTGNSVTLARPVAIAQTALGAENQEAVVRIRQDDAATQKLSFYRVDDLSGDIGGLAPGQAGYAEAAALRAYRTIDGQTDIVGQGNGQESTATLTGINAGDIIASVLSSQMHQMWAFSNQNERTNGAAVNHIYSYGLNTWGYEDTYGGGDHDFNDMVFQLDFTSASGHGYLVGADMTSPEIASITATSDVVSGPVGVGHTVSLRLHANIALSVTAAADGSLPTLVLNDGGTATFDAAASSRNDLVFNTTIEAGQGSPALTATNLALNGATVQSSASRQVADQILLAVKGAQTGLSVGTPPDPGSKTISVFRFFDSSNGSHFYTVSADERASILATRPDLIPEGQDGVGLQAVNPASGDAYAAPVFRFFDTVHGTQFLTASTTERDGILASRPDLTFEPTGSFYEHIQPQVGDTAVYRFFSSMDGTHFYTDNATERASILQTRPDLIAEGIGFYEPGRTA